MAGEVQNAETKTAGQIKTAVCRDQASQPSLERFLQHARQNHIAASDYAKETTELLGPTRPTPWDGWPVRAQSDVPLSENVKIFDRQIR